MAIGQKDKDILLKKYADLASKKLTPPSRADLLKAGISRDKMRSAFGTMENLQKQARKEYPKSFTHIVDQSLFTRGAFKELKEEVGANDKYLITTAVEGCKPHEGFFNAINKSFAKKENALPLILTSMDPAAHATDFHLHSAFRNSNIVFSDLSINDNLFLSSIKLSAKHIDPITGLSRIGQRNGSFIYASPKQRLKMTPTSNTKTPHAMMTTGAVTLPAYDSQRYMSKRTAYIATLDHVIGGIVVEVVDKKLFHFRQVQADKKGSFIDLGKQYNPDGSTESIQPEALILGDWHSGETDPTARAAFLDGPDSVLNITKPRRLVIHDGFNGRSISHHEAKNRILRAQRAARNELDLYTELKELASDLEAMAAYDFIEEIIFVCSNHDEFLTRYLADGRYIEDAQNHLIGLKLAQSMIEGKNPLQTAMEWFGIKNLEKITWLERDEDYKIGGVEVGAHGDKGANGSRGSLRAMENAFGQSVSGHSHTAEILRGAWQVGTCSLLQLNYNTGPSSWTHTSALIYPNGSRQLIHVIEGEWRRK